MNTSDEAPPARWLPLLLFVTIYGSLQLCYVALRGGNSESFLIERATVAPAAKLLQLLFPRDGLVADGSRIAWPQGELVLLNGCDGFELMILLAAAILVAPIGVIQGAKALAIGIAGLWALNQIRIAALYWAVRSHRSWFDPLHTLWCPLVLVVFAVVFFWRFVLRAPSHKAATSLS